jgi:hypothetical protein
MIALFLMGLLATTVILGGLPVVLYALALEMSAQRSNLQGAPVAPAAALPRPRLRLVHAAAA